MRGLRQDPIREGQTFLSPKHPGEMQKTPHISLGKLKSFTLIPVLKKYEKKKYENKKEIENGSLLKKEERKDD